MVFMLMASVGGKNSNKDTYIFFLSIFADDPQAKEKLWRWTFKQKFGAVAPPPPLNESGESRELAQ